MKHMYDHFFPDHRPQTVSETILNSVACGLGVLIGAAAISLLVIQSSIRHDPWRVVSFAIYGATIALPFLSAIFYHSLHADSAKRFFRKFTHISLFAAFAGTWTPIAIVGLGHGGLGWSFFGIGWLIAAGGILLTIFLFDRIKSTLGYFYFGFGWLGAVMLWLGYHATGVTFVIFMIAGGVVLSVGLIFYRLRDRKYFFSISHGLALGGVVLHFFGFLNGLM